MTPSEMRDDQTLKYMVDSDHHNYCYQCCWWNEGGPDLVKEILLWREVGRDLLGSQIGPDGMSSFAADQKIRALLPENSEEGGE